MHAECILSFPLPKESAHSLMPSRVRTGRVATYVAVNPPLPSSSEQHKLVPSTQAWQRAQPSTLETPLHCNHVHVYHLICTFVKDRKRKRKERKASTAQSRRKERMRKVSCLPSWEGAHRAGYCDVWRERPQPLLRLVTELGFKAPAAWSAFPINISHILPPQLVNTQMLPESVHRPGPACESLVPHWVQLEQAHSRFATAG